MAAVDWDTHDIAIRTSGKFLNTISELQALVWYNWCDRTWFYQFIKDGGSTVP
jgi:hypothetical protein